MGRRGRLDVGTKCACRLNVEIRCECYEESNGMECLTGKLKFIKSRHRAVVKEAGNLMQKDCGMSCRGQGKIGYDPPTLVAGTPPALSTAHDALNLI